MINSTKELVEKIKSDPELHPDAQRGLLVGFLQKLEESFAEIGPTHSDSIREYWEVGKYLRGEIEKLS
tara:strand:- start:9959 stop:10162 length:204 start_codon:yes stop_codon:yes gene_type:complete